VSDEENLAALASLFTPPPPGPPVTAWDKPAAGTLTPEILRKALDGWPPSAIPELLRGPIRARAAQERARVLARLDAEVDDRKAWVDGIKARLGLVCTGDPPHVPGQVVISAPPEWPAGVSPDGWRVVSRGEYVLGRDGTEVIAGFVRGEDGVMELVDLRVYPGEDR
jgi:hypothetical protein